VVKAMAGRSGAEIALRGQDKHLHYSRGVTVEEMRQASMALMQLVPFGPITGPKSRDGGGTEAVWTGIRMMSWLWPPDLSRRTM